MSEAATVKEPVLTDEEIQLNKERFLFTMGMRATDPDLDKPEIAKTLNAAQVAAAEAPKVEGVVDGETAKDGVTGAAAPEGEAGETGPDEPVVEPAAEEPAGATGPAEEVVAEPPPSALADPEMIADIAAEKVLARQTPPPEPEVHTFESTLNPAYQKDLRVIRHLEETRALPAGMSARMLDFYRKEADYIAAWDKANPEGVFDANGQEHATFYGRQPQIDPQVFEQGKESLLESEITARVEKRLEPRLREPEFQREFEAEKPRILAQANEAVLSMIERASPDLAKVLEVNGQKVISAQTVKAMDETNPVAFEIVNEEAERLRIANAELAKMVRFGERYPLNPQSAVTLVSTGDVFHPHAFLDSFAQKLETEMAALPVIETVRDGKRFIRQQDLKDRAERISQDKALKPEQKQAAIRDLAGKFWALEQKQIAAGLLAHFSERAKQRIAKFTAHFDRNPANGTPAAVNGAANGTPKPVVAPVKKPVPAAVKRVAAPSMAASDKTNTIAPAAKPDGLTKEDVIKSMWG